ncbi:hypothetical protein C8R43DRAFT_1047280 [Mycena crocata]|nr:hypothetical protein C8R43DRAFT_1047280 [Mycena crocata]
MILIFAVSLTALCHTNARIYIPEAMIFSLGIFNMPATAFVFGLLGREVYIGQLDDALYSAADEENGRDAQDNWYIWSSASVREGGPIFFRLRRRLFLGYMQRKGPEKTKGVANRELFSASWVQKSSATLAKRLETQTLLLAFVLGKFWPRSEPKPRAKEDHRSS